MAHSTGLFECLMKKLFTKGKQNKRMAQYPQGNNSQKPFDIFAERARVGGIYWEPEITLALAVRVSHLTRAVTLGRARLRL